MTQGNGYGSKDPRKWNNRKAPFSMLLQKIYASKNQENMLCMNKY